jgi:hypothetical protein
MSSRSNYEKYPELTHVVPSFLLFVGTLFKCPNLFSHLSTNVGIAKYKKVRLKDVYRSLKLELIKLRVSPVIGG